MSTPRMYVLARLDLSDAYRHVQGTHAVAQYALEFPELFQQWGNSTILVLGVRNLIELREWDTKLREADKKYSLFKEPDLDHQLTAIACYDKGLIFRELPLA